MGAFDRVVQGVAESLYGDERLRSNLTDDEAKVVLDWALARVSERVATAKDESSARKAAQDALARVRPVIAALSDLGKKSGPMRLSDAVTAIEPVLQAGQPFSRAEILTLATTLAQAAMQLRGSKMGIPAAKDARNLTR